jgi:hypothetical protein
LAQVTWVSGLELAEATLFSELAVVKELFFVD